MSNLTGCTDDTGRDSAWLDGPVVNAESEAMRMLAPAKINLHLRVGRPRADGFHPLVSWMTTIGLFDTMSLSEANGITLTCSEPTLPCDDRNIVMKAARMLRADSPLSVAIHLEKQIPHGGGLGGGSADAAFALLALNQFWNFGKSIDELHELAAKLGSDVPFFLHGPSSICRGRGELVKPVSSPVRARWVLLILPNLALPTPAVYRKFDEMNLGSNMDDEPDWTQWTGLSSQDLLGKLVNDLEPPAFAIEPALGRLRADLEEQLARFVRMSGSGSSLFTLYDDKAEAETAAESLANISARLLIVAMAPV